MSILICYDDSDSARRALQVARHTLGHQEMVLLHVYREPEMVLPDSFSVESTMPATGLASRARLESMAATYARRVLDHGRALAGDLVLETRAQEATADEPLWRAILDVADELHPDLIVVGTRGTTVAGEEILGSVSNGLIRHSARPVLIVPQG